MKFELRSGQLFNLKTKRHGKLKCSRNGVIFTDRYPVILKRGEGDWHGNVRISL